MKNTENQMYPTVDAQALGEHYLRHIQAMTAEGLHDKSAIAEQLAWRDKLLAELKAKLGRLESTARSACEMCRGIKGGEPGNENVVNGVVMCDYCHSLHLKASDADPVWVAYRARILELRELCIEDFNGYAQEVLDLLPLVVK